MNAASIELELQIDFEDDDTTTETLTDETTTDPATTIFEIQNIQSENQNIISNTTLKPDHDDDDDDDDNDEDKVIDSLTHKKPSNNNENTVVVETNPVNNIHIEIPQVAPAVIVPVSECSDCGCGCEIAVDKPCKTCDRPCSACESECCSKPPPSCCPTVKPSCCKHPPCNICSPEVITTVEVIETCSTYEEVIHNDESQLIKRNHTFHSSYNIKASDFVLEHQEAQQFKNESRKGICSIWSDENQSLNATNVHSLNHTKGSAFAGFVNQNNNQPTKQCQIVSGWSCRKIGKYPHPTSCQKYVQCHLCGDNSVYECPYEQAFDGKQCTTDWSTCGRLKECQHNNQLIPDPWNHRNYFLCVRKKGFFHKYLVFRRFCPDGFEFDPIKLECSRTVIVIVKPCNKPCKHCENPCNPPKPTCHSGCSSNG